MPTSLPESQRQQRLQHLKMTPSGNRWTAYLDTEDEQVRASVSHVTELFALELLSFSSLDEFIQQYSANQLSLLIVDASLERVRPSPIQQELQNRAWFAPVIMIFDPPDTSATVRALKNGAITVLDKPLKLPLLHDAILEAMHENIESRAIAVKADQARKAIEQLSLGQKAVLDLVLEGIPNKTIARMLGTSMRTIEGRRSRIYQKLEVDSVARLVRKCVLARYIEP